jgi:hypothetical protein
LKPGKYRQASPTCAASSEIGTITDVRKQGKEVGVDVFVNKSNLLCMDISWFTYIIKTAMNQNYLRKQTRKEY